MVETVIGPTPPPCCIRPISIALCVFTCGRNATPEQAQEVHAFIRTRIGERDAKIAAATRILYGGSVKAGNAADLFAMSDVDGGLIGGASLKADEFLTILSAARIPG